ncbi:MAG: alpha/beta hydrolase, partial [Clostridia bacterium]|nr:alpha/beta hydrolase [Clostridia bacterium]
LIATVCAAAVLFIFLLLLVFAFLAEGFAFGKRCDKNPLLKYFTADDFSLTAEPVSAGRGLKGFIYRKDGGKEGKIIIFCHGMGPGHIAYTTEIAYFCNLGYTVLALDSRGCNYSDGKNLKGMYSGVETVKAAIDFVKENFADSKIYLVGHSWGAYSALCASAERKVGAVVAISAPSSPSKTMQEGAANVGMPKILAALLRPLWWIVNLFKFGAKGNANAAKCARKNGVPTLIVHGDKDRIVTPSKAVYYKAEGANITKLLVSGKAHNPYNTENAEKLLAEIPKRLKSGEEGMRGFDFNAVTEEDKAVMEKIACFLENS